jgi:transcriptional regulator with XRE-family HTH domain
MTIDRRNLPHPVDILVGAKLREIRSIHGLSQVDLAKYCNITFQQVQKYESGANRISASRMYEFATIFKVSPAVFFPVTPDEGSPLSNAAERGDYEFAYEPNRSKEVLGLIKAFNAIQDKQVRQRLFSLMRALGGDADAEGEESEVSSVAL